MGHFRQIDPLSTLSACPLPLRSRPNLRAAAIRRGVPRADVSRCGKKTGSELLDHLVGERKQGRWHRKAKPLRSFEVDDKLELGGLHHR